MTFCFFFYSIYYPRTALALPPRSSSSQIRGHIAGSPPRSPLRTVPAFIFIARKNSSIFSLVDSRRIVRLKTIKKKERKLRHATFPKNYVEVRRALLSFHFCPIRRRIS